MCLQHMRTHGLRCGSVPEVCMIFCYPPSPGTQSLTRASPLKMMGEIIINGLTRKAKAGRFQNCECPQRPSIKRLFQSRLKLGKFTKITVAVASRGRSRPIRRDHHHRQRRRPLILEVNSISEVLGYVAGDALPCNNIDVSPLMAASQMTEKDKLSATVW